MNYKKNKFKIVYYIFIINILFDIVTGFLPTGSTLAIIRGIILYIIIMSVLWQHRHEKFPNYTILFLFFYLFILTFFSSDRFISQKIFAQVMLSIFMYPVGYYLVKNITILEKFNKTIIVVAIIIVINTFVSTLLGYGFKYGQNQFIETGNLAGHALLTIVYVTLILLFVLRTSNSRVKNLFLSIVFISLIFISILSLIRTIISSLMIGGIIFYYYDSNKTRFLKYLPLLFIVVVFFSVTIGGPLISFLESQFSVRKKSYETSIITKELRYEETLIVWGKALSFSDWEISLFGRELFNSMGKYANWTYGNRQLHVDYNNILFGSGFIGLLIYLLMYFSFYKKFKYYEKKLLTNLSNPYFNSIRGMFYAFLFLSLWISFSGQMYGITFRSINFFYLGAFTSLLKDFSMKYLSQDNN